MSTVFVHLLNVALQHGVTELLWFVEKTVFQMILRRLDWVNILYVYITYYKKAQISVHSATILLLLIQLLCAYL